MLQVKLWSWNVSKPHGKTAKQIEKEINDFLIIHNCKRDNVDIDIIDDILFAKVFYYVRK